MNHAYMDADEVRESQLQGGVIAAHSRPKDGVASLAYDAAIHERVQRMQS